MQQKKLKEIAKMGAQTVLVTYRLILNPHRDVAEI
jgi:hypothetical protein